MHTKSSTREGETLLTSHSKTNTPTVYKQNLPFVVHMSFINSPSPSAGYPPAISFRSPQTTAFFGWSFFGRSPFCSNKNNIGRDVVPFLVFQSPRFSLSMTPHLEKFGLLLAGEPLERGVERAVLSLILPQEFVPVFGDAENQDESTRSSGLARVFAAIAAAA